MRELNYRGFRGREYNANTIGRNMKKLNFESRVIHGTRKYRVAKVDYALHNTENKEDVKITEKEDKRSRSTDVYANENINVTSVILSNRNFEKQNKKIYIPNYAISCIDEILV